VKVLTSAFEQEVRKAGYATVKRIPAVVRCSRNLRVSIRHARNGDSNRNDMGNIGSDCLDRTVITIFESASRIEALRWVR
jgi:hypothetical protein